MSRGTIQYNRAGRDQPRGRDHWQQRLAATGCHGREDVAHLRIAGGHRVDDATENTLMRTEWSRHQKAGSGSESES